MYSRCKNEINEYLVKRVFVFYLANSVIYITKKIGLRNQEKKIVVVKQDETNVKTGVSSDLASDQIIS